MDTRVKERHSPSPPGPPVCRPMDPSEKTRHAIRVAAERRAALHAAARAGDTRAGAEYPESKNFLEQLTAPAALDALTRGDHAAWEYALCFLEVYPRCPDSGFAVRDLVRAIKHAELPEYALPRLRTALLSIAAQPARDELKHLRHLALKVADEPFLHALDDLAAAAPDDLESAARTLADYITRRWDTRTHDAD